MGHIFPNQRHYQKNFEVRQVKGIIILVILSFLPSFISPFFSLSVSNSNTSALSPLSFLLIYIRVLVSVS
ncbi:hypothetical protein PGT21_021837 [Puccinia graminis f. sp. tritici]|uniref:Uncharacterized protein n=1 Tax=Puccinia graminis f. sp. tritici TaxID=56615 RepID=A0A5B0N6X6_PUCGR|nr:hypothetical protein PGT21_021837 [Puccinia graminis f. sp. tritici]